MKAKILGLIAAVAFFMPLGVQAAVLQFSLEESSLRTWTWQLPAEPAPALFDLNRRFAVFDVDLALNGVSQGLARINFAEISVGGGVAIDFNVNQPELSDFFLTGAQVFDGPATSPIFKPGTFMLRPESRTAPDASLVITAANVPEPATLALLGLGLAGVGFGAARRRRAN